METNYSSETIMRNQKKGNPLVVFFLLIVLAGVIGVTAYYLYPRFFGTQQSHEIAKTPEPTPAPTENPYITFDEKPAVEDAIYFEKTPLIEGQQAYVAYPITYNKNFPPQLIVYGHGSNTTVTINFKEDNMINMRAYAQYFTDKGYAFSASAQHGANWGSQASIDDMTKLINWVNESYKIQPQVNLIAHSMGGLPIIKFAMQHPAKIYRVALLAPTSRSETYKKAEIDALAPVQIKIWHGDKDVNVPWSLSSQFVAFAKRNGKSIDFVTLKGKTHWDVDTELMPEILDFFNSVSDIQE